MKKQAYNPYLPLCRYIPDGEPHVFGDRIYVFGSQDRAGGDTFCELDYEFWSAPVDDLGNWTSRGVSYSAKQDALFCENRKYLYAPDVVKGNDGRYYLYYSLSGFKGKGGYHGPISVAVCDTPDGKYEYLGFLRNPDGTPFNKYVCFDPAVINDDGTIRLYYGASMPLGMVLPRASLYLTSGIFSKIYGKTREELLSKEGVWGANMLTLEDDMVTVKTQPVRIIPDDARGTDFAGHAFFEGASIRKIEDTYYFIYSSQLNHELCYATSRFPDRDFRYGGTIVSAGDIGIDGRTEKASLNAVGTTHGSIEKIGGEWYVFYHRLTHGSDYSRQGCAEKITIEPDGSIRQVEVTSCGLNNGPLKTGYTYPAAIACNITNGRMPRISNRKSRKPVPMVVENEKGSYITNIDNTTTVTYKHFDFGKDCGQIRVNLASRAYGTIDALLDGQIVGSARLTHTDETTAVISYKLSETGIKALSLRLSGEGTIDIFSFEIAECE